MASTAQPAATTPPLFSLRDARVMRSGRTILHVDHFDLAEGEHVALLGPNGAGKSTFIQLLTRETYPLHREEPPVRFRGQARPLLSDIKQALGIVSATMHDQVRVHLPVSDIVCGGLFGTLGLPNHVQETDEQRAKAQDALDRLGIADLAERDVMTLSTGQVRRVLVARELMSDPRILIFDEPCTGLDPEGMYHVRNTMRLWQTKGARSYSSRTILKTSSRQSSAYCSSRMPKYLPTGRRRTCSPAQRSPTSSACRLKLKSVTAGTHSKAATNSKNGGTRWLGPPF